MDEHSKRGNRLEVVQALVLSLATVATAWCGYQAALWSGIQSIHLSETAAGRVEASRYDTLSGEYELADLLLFNQWFDADLRGDVEIARRYESRFRPQFRPAFEAWRRDEAAHPNRGPAGPLTLPEYQKMFRREIERADRDARRSFEGAKRAKATGDAYVQSTVLLALVLFFMAVAPRFVAFGVRVGLTCVGLAALVLAVVRLVALPVAH